MQSMAACIRCGFQQNGTQTYCEHCGMFLPTLAIYNPPQPEYTVTSRVLPYQKQKIVAVRRTSSKIIDRCVGAIIAFFGLCIASFGLFGGLDSIIGANIALLLGLFLLIGGIIFVTIRLIVQKPLPRILLWQRIVGVLSVTVSGFIVMLLVSGTLQTHKGAMNISFGATLFLYGLIIAVIALW
jgi:hypothetical protein